MRAGGGVNGGGHGPRGPQDVHEQPPTHELDLERLFLGSCFTYPELVAESGIASTDLYSPANAFVLEAMTRIVAAGEDLNTLSVRYALEQSDRLDAVGGHDFLLGLTDTIPLRKHDFTRLKKLARMRDLQEAAMRLSAVSRAGGDVTGALEALERARRELEEVGRPAQAHPLERMWRTVGEWGALDQQPPPRKWLLTRPDHETAGRTMAGVMQLGKVGLLVAAGGAGKTIALVGLALAIATGRRWLNHFSIACPGRVLIALAEEDAEEVHRRFFAVARAMRLTDEQIQLASSRIVALPLCGVPVTLLDADGQDTEMLRTLRKRIAAEAWSLVILDPLSRFAGVDTETDNAAATRFIQATESLIQGPDAPAMLLAHHTHKGSRVDGSRASAAHSRGASALVDGARWAAELESHGDDGARFTIVKSNYGQQGLPLELVRDADGHLRAATMDELEHARCARQSAQAERDVAEFSEVGERVLAALKDKPDQPKAKLAGLARVSDRTAGRVVDWLEGQGKVVKSSRYGYSLPEDPNAPKQEVLDV